MPDVIPKSRADRRKLMIYAGVAGAFLIILLLRRNSDATQTQPAEQPLTPVASAAPASDGLGAGSGGLDNSAQLASFENALLDQLPASIESGIAAGIANGVSAPLPGGVGDGSPSPTVLDVPALLTAAGGLITLGAGLAGQQHAAATSHSTSKAKSKKKPHPHPAHPNQQVHHGSTVHHKPKKRKR